MKKLMIAAAIVCAAAMSQAATYRWTSDALTGVTVANVGDNGDYAAGGSALKNNSTLNYVMTFYTAGTETVVKQFSGSVAYAMGAQTASVNFKDDALVQGTTYDWVLELTGNQTDLRAKVSDEYDYSASTIEATLSGTVAGKPSGAATLSATPATWTVAGVTAVPEPTSGLLLLLGVAGLALRRRRA